MSLGASRLGYQSSLGLQLEKGILNYSVGVINNWSDGHGISAVEQGLAITWHESNVMTQQVGIHYQYHFPLSWLRIHLAVLTLGNTWMINEHWSFYQNLGFGPYKEQTSTYQRIHRTALITLGCAYQF